MAERYSPDDLPNAQILYALARHVLAGREHTYRQETNGSALGRRGAHPVRRRGRLGRVLGHDLARGRGREEVALRGPRPGP